MKSKMTPPIVTFLTDFGIQDSYVAEMKGVILKYFWENCHLSPGRRSQIYSPCFVDITHGIQAFDILSAARLLGHAYRRFPPGTVHLAIVDPDVGGNRKSIMLSAAGHSFVGPDNGLFSVPVQDDVQHYSAFEIKPLSPKVSATFHGRDIFAPIAAAIASGRPMRTLGTRIKAILTLPQILPLHLPGQQGWRARIVAIDHFGNLATNIPSAWLKEFKHPCLKIKKCTIDKFISTFSLGLRGKISALINSYGEIEIVVPSGSAQKALGAKVNGQVILQEKKL